MPAVLSGRMTVTTLGRPPHRAREGHGQHLQIRSLVSNPDDRHADHLGLDATLRVVEPPSDDRRLNALMVFKNIRDPLVAAARTCTLSVSASSVFQDHPVHIPRGWVTGDRKVLADVRFLAHQAEAACIGTQGQHLASR